MAGQLLPSVAQSRGNVSGKLIYPSDWFPPQVVCAVPVDGGNRFCTKVREGQSSFSMQLPAGRYYFSSEYNGVKAWYTTFDNDCGANCGGAPVTARIVIIDEYSLTPNSVTGICVCDWYNTGNIMFPR
jgi:hypothetical protein